MKKAFFLFALSISIISCSNKNSKEDTDLTDEQQQIELGKTGFDNYGCVACHHTTNKIIGPAVKTIAETYKNNQASVYDFLKMKSAPIVDNNESMVTIMRNNLETTVTKIPEEDLKAITAYIESVSK